MNACSTGFVMRQVGNKIENPYKKGATVVSLIMQTETITKKVVHSLKFLKSFKQFWQYFKI